MPFCIAIPGSPSFFVNKLFVDGGLHGGLQGAVTQVLLNGEGDDARTIAFCLCESGKFIWVRGPIVLPFLLSLSSWTRKTISSSEAVMILFSSIASGWDDDEWHHLAVEGSACTIEGWMRQH